MDYQLSYRVGHIQQANRNDCWAASFAMLMGRHSNAGTEHVKQLCRAQNVTLETDGSLPPGSVQSAAQAVHLGYRDIRGHAFPSAGDLAHWLRRGPVAVFGRYRFDGDNRNHVLVFTGLSGNGDVLHTFIDLIDPYTGRSEHVDYYQLRNRITVNLDFVVSR